MRSFAVAEGREAKARLIEDVLCASLGAQHISGRTILDIGTGSGHIAKHFAASNSVTAADVENQIIGSHHNFEFVQIDSPHLPFPDALFDIVILNHVLTYIPNQLHELVEVRRVLKPEGICYISMPNRLFPIEPHSRAPLIHYLPQRIYSKIINVFTCNNEFVRMYTYPGMLKLFRSAGFIAHDFTVPIAHDPDRFRSGTGLKFPRWKWLTLLSPTNIFVLTVTTRE